MMGPPGGRGGLLQRKDEAEGGAEVGAETVLPASFRLRPVFPPRPPDGKGPPDAMAAGESFAS